MSTASECLQATNLETIAKIEEAKNTCACCALDKFQQILTIESCLQYVARKLYYILVSSLPDANQNVSITSLTLFLQFLNSSVNMSIEEGIIAVEFLKRFIQKQSFKGMQVMNVKNLGMMLLVLVIVTMKTHRDHPNKNSHFANIFGIQLPLLNYSEAAFLRIMDYELLIEETAFSLQFEEIFQLKYNKIIS
ncbi:MAG: hypothetical protein EZS28_009838 [Streblomastix strix]|uniref:Cyclin N-terminal domain-containing protein n=1 Tax=Streblomastix strix TaxID=222440 RepID=A0A5J4WHV0_9EUKA|nr:MAG: hypothetical protein EZS28_009838 [Streblomastix strix]